MKKKRNLSTPQHVFVLQAKTPLRSIPNALTFKVKRTCVSSKTYLRLKANALAFFTRISLSIKKRDTPSDASLLLSYKHNFLNQES